ncbi:hypothetical protein ACFX1X_012265 [Malus domestica]
MARSGLDLGAPNGALSSAQISEHKESTSPSYINDDDGDDGGVQVTCFSEVVNETTFHLQIIRLLKQEKLSMRSKQKKLFEFWPFCLQPCKLFAIKINPANRFNNMSWNSIGHYQRNLHILAPMVLVNGEEVVLDFFNSAELSSAELDSNSRSV